MTNSEKIWLKNTCFSFSDLSLSVSFLTVKGNFVCCTKLSAIEKPGPYSAVLKDGLVSQNQVRFFSQSKRKYVKWRNLQDHRTQINTFQTNNFMIEWHSRQKPIFGILTYIGKFGISSTSLGLHDLYVLFINISMAAKKFDWKLAGFFRYVKILITRPWKGLN